MTHFFSKISKPVILGMLVLTGILCSSYKLYSRQSNAACLADLWESDFSENWKERWKISSHALWGEENLKIVEDDSELQLGKILEVIYPQGSASPAVSRDAGVPLGGANFYATLGMSPQDTLHLRYYVKFDDEFDFVKGGKLPGLYGGTENNGGKIPDGTNGFSTRYMWRKNGAWELYAYLPTSDIHGTQLGTGNWTFEPGKWYMLEQLVILNKPGKANGKIKVWIDEELVLSATNLLFRTTDQLKIEGIFFSTFFGGGDVSFSTRQTTKASFAKFAVSKTYIGK